MLDKYTLRVSVDTKVHRIELVTMHPVFEYEGMTGAKHYVAAGIEDFDSEAICTWFVELFTQQEVASTMLKTHRFGYIKDKEFIPLTSAHG